MGNFRPNNRNRGFRDRAGSGRGFGSGRSFSGERSERARGFGGRDRRGEGERRRPEMHQAVCAKCGEECEVPFRPSGDKPVLCSNCFKKEGGGRDRFNSDSRNASKQSEGMSQEQFKQINAKLDKIISILDQIEFEEIDEEEEGEEENA